MTEWPLPVVDHRRFGTEIGFWVETSQGLSWVKMRRDTMVSIYEPDVEEATYGIGNDLSKGDVVKIGIEYVRVASHPQSLEEIEEVK